MEIEAEVRLINQKLDTIEKYITEDRSENKKHIDSAQPFRDRVITLEQRVDSHSTEHGFYRWLFGLIVTIGLLILGKLYL